MKKVLISMLILLTFIFLVGCLDYKAYDLPQDEDINLVDELVQIDGQPITEEVMDEVEEEIILPELDEVDTTLQEINAKESELIKLKATVTDPDMDVVAYTFTKPLNARGEWQTHYGDAGEYLVTLSATDGKLTTEKKLKIIVARVNVAPVLSGVKDLIVNEGEVIKFTPLVSDPNNDPVTLTISDPLASGTFATDYTSAGEYQISVVASDGELNTERTFLLKVQDVNVLPEVKEESLFDIIVKEGETVTIKPQISDLDGDDLTVKISAPVGDDGVWETEYTDHGVYSVTITIDDGKDKVIKTIQVTVNDVNMPPQIEKVYLDLN